MRGCARGRQWNMPAVQSGNTKEQGLKILKLNTNHCKAAQDLLWQTAEENKIDIVLLSEPYEDIQSYNWVTDSEKSVAIWVRNGKALQRKMTTPRKGYTWVKQQGVYYVSCYAPPRWTLEEFEQMMLSLETELKGKRPILVAGDFNAWSKTWGSQHTSSRGKILEDTFAAMDLTLLNTPGIYTFDGARGRSIIDLAVADSTTSN